MKTLDRGQLATLAIGASLATVGGLVTPVAAWRYAAATAGAPQLVRSLARTTFEERRLAAYGYCEPMGLGYVSDVLRALPDPGAMPLIRYRDWDRGVELLLPDRRDRIEDRVLVGIGVRAEDFSPAIVGRASFRGSERDGDAFLDHWTFRTHRDIELLTGISVRIGDAGAVAPFDLRLRLVESRKSTRVLGEWVFSVPGGPGGEIRHQLAKPIDHFSVNRGATDFLLEVRRPASAPRAEEITAVGSRLDGNGWTIVMERGHCLVAMRDDLLAEASRDRDGPWARFLSTAGHARSR